LPGCRTHFGESVNDHREKPGGLQLGQACRIRLIDSSLLYRPLGSRENVGISNIDRGVDISMSLIAPRYPAQTKQTPPDYSLTGFVFSHCIHVSQEELARRSL
jgi:hypothetical protein